MRSPVTIVMYHYVRPIAGSYWPGIRGLESAHFEAQVNYLRRHYSLVGLTDVVEARRGGRPLAEMPAVLTFDDGYADHIRHAFPVLHRLGIAGAFFPPSCAVLDRRVLDVNKVHFILAVVADPNVLVAAVEAEVDRARDEFDLAPLTEYRQRYCVTGRFDIPEVIYVKRMLQVALPEALRARVVDRLFCKYVSVDEQSFADDLYLSSTDLATMLDGGMEVGSHGHGHCWLGALSREDQAADIDRSLALLDAIGTGRDEFLFCYPYGSYNTDTISVLSERGCVAAVTTRVDLANLSDSLLELPRLDTNDLPREANAPANEWTAKARLSGGLGGGS
jgi:peptidoglycan/xylan/chitin deacetylase (PgdA/CDA1 family)